MKFWQTLKVAFYNKAVEYEHLGMNLKAVEAYEKSEEILKVQTQF